MFRIVLLGTGGPRPDPKRNATTTLIRLGSQNILFDAGRGVVVQMTKAGVPLNTLGPVFITHHHFDHIGDLYDVMLSTWMQGRKGALQIYGPPDTERIAEALLTQVYDKDWKWRSMGEPAFGGWKPIAVTDIAAGQTFEGDGWRVTPYRVRHGDGLDFPKAFLQRWTCYGYRFEAGGRVIAISGDTVDCPGLEELAKGADVLVHCCYMARAEIENEHFARVAQHTLPTSDEVGRIAARAGCGTLVLTHHRPRARTDYAELLAGEAREHFSGRILVGEDLMEIDVA